MVQRGCEVMLVASLRISSWFNATSIQKGSGRCERGVTRLGKIAHSAGYLGAPVPVPVGLHNMVTSIWCINMIIRSKPVYYLVIV